MGATSRRPARGGRDICAIRGESNDGLESAGLCASCEGACGALQCYHATLGSACDEEPSEKDIDVPKIMVGECRRCEEGSTNGDHMAVTEGGGAEIWGDVDAYGADRGRIRCHSFLLIFTGQHILARRLRADTVPSRAWRATRRISARFFTCLFEVRTTGCLPSNASKK